MLKLTAKILLILIILLATQVIKGADCSQLSDLKWLLGQWEIKNETTLVRETWKQVSKETFEGKGESIDRKTGKIKFAEAMRIVTMSGKIFFLAKVDENPYPVPFKLTSCSQKSALFENPAHDFPKKLKYYMPDDELLVDVLGKDDKGYTINYTAIFTNL